MARRLLPAAILVPAAVGGLRLLGERLGLYETTGKEGAGLGLAIVKGLADAHDGHVWAESKPGVGSTFFFTLPLVATAEEHAAHPG